ncbi:MAG: flavin reductase family protein [Flavobacteriales bacterium]|nr:flavin reductase family protein [Flavobacteriales bacterium]
MRSINPKDLEIPQLHQFLLGSVGPRPICFASTIDKEGNKNLAPFSFFNVFSANPPILVFSPARSGRTGVSKDTFLNCKEVPEVVINIVNYAMVEQVSLASSPYPKGVDEFVKAGFTAVDSDMVKPARVAESPIQLECKVNEIVELGQGGGAGNLVICEVLKLHIREELIDEKGHIIPQKLDLVARMGGNYYCRANGDALFEIPKPLTTIGVGVDVLPDKIKKSEFLSGNDLGKIGQMEKLATPDELAETPIMKKTEALAQAKKLLHENKTEEAYKLLLKNL